MASPSKMQVEHVVLTHDGRRLRVLEGGHRDGRPILFHHGGPGAGDLYAPHVKDALDQGIRLIGYDRPGYGSSSRHPGSSVGDSAADVRAIANALAIDRLAVWGMSAGGPHALACAALMPDLVVAAATLASPAPYGIDGFDYFAGMGQANVDDIRLQLDDEAAALAKLPADREAVLALTPENMAQNMQSLMSEADAPGNNLAFAEWIIGGMRTGLAETGDGWWDDSAASLKPWGFELGSIRVPVQVWHGRQDRFVPVQHGEWLGAQIPGADVHIIDEDGHGTVAQHRMPLVHAWLLKHFD